MNSMLYKSGKLVSQTILPYLERLNKPSILLTKPLGKVNTSGLRPILNQVSDIAKFDTIVPINLSSEAVKFFGVDSLKNLYKLESAVNHATLDAIMANFRCYSGPYTSMQNFKKIFFATPLKSLGFETVKHMCTPHFPVGISGVKLTFTGFKFMGEDAMHSIGFIRDYKGNLFVLDSLGDEIAEMRKFHDKIAQVILENEKGVGNPIKKVIFNRRAQQGEIELTCNNWTLANLRAVRETLEQKNIHTAEELDEVLPRDINKILKEQMNLVKQHKV